MNFNDFSIKRKLTLIILLPSVTVLAVASTALGVYDHRRSLEAVVQHASQLSSFITTNSAAPLVFRDTQSANEVLASLDGQKDVRAAAIYDADGRVFARFRQPLSGETGVPHEDHAFFTPDLYVVYRGIFLEGERLGTFHTEIDLATMNARRDGYIGFVALLLFLLSAVTLVVSTRVQQVFSRPVLELVGVAQQVTKAKDYSIRAKKRSADEVGLLVDSFNGMLAQIQDRDNQLRGEGDRLEAEVASRTKALQEANKQLEAAKEEALETNRAQSQFIANMTHEIRTPMNGVLGMAELLFNTDLSPQQQKFTRTVLESAEDLLSIINNILDFSKAEAGKLEKIDCEPFSPRECVEKVSELLVSRAEPKGLTLSHECADDVPIALLGDGKRLRQVLTNIVGNAIKFTDHGTIVVRTSLVEAVGGIGTIRFEVVDTGVGIPTHLHQHVFEGFSQADTSTTRQFGGTGLGLAISKHLVELMGGQIGVISRPNVGSNFWFTIKGELWQSATAADRNLEGVRALIVATTHSGRDALRLQLTTFGAECAVFASDEKALRELRSGANSKPYDVALIDTQALDWYALARAIRSDESTKSIPLILVSTVARGDGELRDAGIDGSIKQPIIESELFACVARVSGRLNVSVGETERRRMETDAWGSGVDQEVTTTNVATSGARVLVAEDNLVNREVATTMLETLKCQVDVVEDGVRAVDAVQREPYDLVFLDCQMPNLDGYGAAQRIRDLEREGRVAEAPTRTARHLPVVALTAHSAPADRARSLESGMDDYVCKPFGLKTLQAVLDKWIDGRPDSETLPAPVAAMSRPSGSDAPGADPIRDAALTEILELDRQKGGGIFVRVVRGYLETAPGMLGRVQSALAEGDAAGVAHAAHDLKSASHNVGAETLADLSKKLEALGRDGTMDGAEPLAAQLDELFVKVTASLEARLSRHSQETALSA